jgi:hypothetical protein
VMAVADVAEGPNAGTYFAKTGCPPATERAVAGMAASW